MPRYVNSVANPRSRQDRAKKANRYRFAHRQWIDPFPTVPGTKPEKMVYAQLMFRGINFQFIPLFNVNLPLLDISKNYRPDFILPDFKIIIEVQGVYWHSKPESMESDAYKQALYNMMGYEVLAWWDYDIENNVVDLFARHPRLSRAGGSGGRIVSATDQDKIGKVDNSKGIRTVNARRFRPKTPKVRTSRGRRRRVLSSYAIK